MGQLGQDTQGLGKSLATLGMVLVGVIVAVGILGLGMTLPGSVTSAPVAVGSAAVAPGAASALPVTTNDPSVPSAAEALAGHAGSQEEASPTF